MNSRGVASDRAVLRNAMLRLAILSSIFGKASGLALQAVAIPLVYRSLGQHSYELYVLLTAALGAISLAQMGAGPGLTQALVKARVVDRRDHEATALAAALKMSAVTAAIGGAIVVVVIYGVPTERLFGVNFVGDRTAILRITDICVFVLMAQIGFTVVDSALAGYQEQMLSNVGAMLANLFSIGLLVFVCGRNPTIISIVLVLYGVPTLSRVVNLIILFVRRPYLLAGLWQSSRGFYSALINVGLAFWTIQVGSIIEQNGGIYLLAHVSDTQATNLFAVGYRVISLAGAVVIVITQPLWPAFADAVAHRDVEWIRRSYAQIRIVVTGYSLVVGVLTAIIGPVVVQRFLGMNEVGRNSLFLALGIYFVANTWTHLYYVTLMGTKSIWKVALIVLSENVSMLLIALLLVPHFGATGMALAYLIASVALPVWLLPLLMKSSIRRISDGGASAAAD